MASTNKSNREIAHVGPTHRGLASSATARNINRDTVLELIRIRQPISRAELGRISGLQPSTVCSIAEQLIAERWVKEGPVAKIPRGRRPAMLELNPEIAVIAVDIRPAQGAIAAVDLKGNILERQFFPVQPDPSRTVTHLIEDISLMLARFPQNTFEGIGVSLPGRVDPRTKRLIFAPNLKWRDFELKKRIESSTGLNVEVDNAANACLCSEVWFGRMIGVRDAVLVTVSEGIGTGIMTNGQVVVGQGGMAGEFGHISLDASGPACGCGRNGCWETFGSWQAALRYHSERAPGSPNISYPDLLTLADDGDPAALGAIRKQAEHIGRGLRLITDALSPELILLAGEMTSRWHLFAETLEAGLASGLLAGSPPRLVPIHDGDLARLRGAGALVLHRQARNLPGSLFAKPSDAQNCRIPAKSA